MNTMKQFIILAAAIFLLPNAWSQHANRFTFEPLVGTETVLVNYPTPNYHTRATYGARVLYGVTLFSGEVEYTQAQSDKSYSGGDEVETKSQRLSLGFRSTFPMGKYFGFHFRAGGRASQGETKVVKSGVSDTKQDPKVIDPYGGAGIQLAFANNLALNLGITLIRNSEDEYDKQYTVGLSTRFGK